MQKSFLLILIFFTTHLFAQTNSSKQAITEKVFENLVNAYGSNKSSPAIKVLPKKSPKIVAQYIAYPTATVQIDEDVFDICMSFGKDANNALAIVLSHELAHYYNDHNWCSDYAFALQNSTLGKTLNKVSKENKIEKESIADSYGLFYASIAGYQPFEIFNPLLDKIYTHYKLAETVTGYPSKKERKEINQIQKDKIEKLIPVFEAGVVMLHLKYYDEAASCFQYLTKFFPSREMYNNLGVCKVFQALNYKTNNATNFIYPIEIDATSRIYQQSDRGADTTINEKKIKALINDAKNAFEKSISLDPQYIKSYINLACLYDIRGNYQAALGVVAEASNLSNSIDNNLQLVKAIALYHNNNIDESRKILQNLSKSKNDICEYNHQLAENIIISKNNIKTIEDWKDNWVAKKIVLSTDTCIEQFKNLNKTIENNATTITENTFVAGYNKGNKSLLSIQTKKAKINISINSFKTNNNNLNTTSTNFIAKNGNCFNIQFPYFYWQITFKEIRNE